MSSIIASFGTGLVTSLLDTVSESSFRAAKMTKNAAEVKASGHGWPVDASVMIANVVSSFSNPVNFVHYMMFYGFKCEVPDDEFFQHSVLGNAHPMSMNDWRIDTHTPSDRAFAETIDTTVWATQSGLDVGQILTLRNRENLSDESVNWQLNRLGVRDFKLQEAIASLRYEVPGVSDLVRFAVRDAFTPEIVAKYGYAEEYPTAIDKYIRWQGLGWNTGYQSPGGSDESGFPRDAHDATWGEIAWFAHWELPSPTQAYEMYHMLYPASRFGPSPYVLDVAGKIIPSLVFTSGDLSQLLKTADYPAYWRPRLEAIANPPLTRVDIRRMYEMGIIGEAEVYHNYRAGGYDDRNAWNLTRFTIAKERPDVSKEVCKLYVAGILGFDEAVALMVEGRLSELEATQRLQHCELTENQARITRSVAEIKSSYLHGGLTNGQAAGLLGELGVNAAWVTKTLADWDLERSYSQKIPTLKLVVSWYVEGYETRNLLISRLQKLNYTDQDISRLLQQADARKVKLETAERKADEKSKAAKAQKPVKAAKQKAAAKQAVQKKDDSAAKARDKKLHEEQQARAKELVAADKAEAAELKKAHDAAEAARKHLAAASSDKFLVAVWNKGLITLDELKARLTARGLLDEDIDRWIDAFIGGGEHAESEEETPG